MTTHDTSKWQGPFVIWAEGPIFYGDDWYERARAAKPDDCEWTVGPSGYATWKPKPVPSPNTYVAE